MEFEAKLFRLPTIAGRESFAVHRKAGGLSSRRVGAESPCQGPGYQLPPSGAPGIILWGVGRVTESGFLLSESACFLCRSALAREALQA